MVRATERACSGNVGSSRQKRVTHSSERNILRAREAQEAGSMRSLHCELRFNKYFPRFALFRISNHLTYINCTSGITL
jgi:hypothetical protein